AALWKQACDGGDPVGCRYLGVAYLEGRGLPEGTAAAAVWLEMACTHGDGPGCRLLAGLHAAGTGVPRDDARAKELLARACEKGDPTACSAAPAPPAVPVK
ncbi:MAG: sel1 repeat family protein, partial [Actinobacteria bacterium]|nr:sel1 repeat family protein [Actinomycetota bacterium]